MPCVKCSNGKYRFGSGACRFATLKSCREFERRYYARKRGGKLRK